MYPIPAPSAQGDGPGGHSYGAIIAPDGADASARVDRVLRDIRFSGWIAPPADGVIVVVGDPGDGVVADDRRGIIEAAGQLAAVIRGPVLAVRVRGDRQLSLVAWSSAEEVVRYCSDPSREPGADPEVLTDPIGAEGAGVLADLWHRPDAEEKLGELLEEELDPDSVNESERLGIVLRLLGLPTWIVSAGALPRAMPRGPAVSELTRLRAGATGIAGRSRDAALGPLRKRQQPPPVIEDPPTGMAPDPWMF